MAKDRKKRLRPLRLQHDVNAYMALQSFKDYQPVNQAYTVENLSASLESLQSLHDAEVNAQNALASARDAAVAAEWAFHNAVLGVKDQVIAQYGADSDQVQSLGLKKKSERKSPKRRKAQ